MRMSFELVALVLSLAVLFGLGRFRAWAKRHFRPHEVPPEFAVLLVRVIAFFAALGILSHFVDMLVLHR